MTEKQPEQVEEPELTESDIEFALKTYQRRPGQAPRLSADQVNEMRQRQERDRETADRFHALIARHRSADE